MLTFQCLLKKQLTPQTSLLKHPSNFTFAKASTIFLLNQLNQTLHLSPDAVTCSNLQFDLCEFEEKVFVPFLDALTAEVINY